MNSSMCSLYTLWMSQMSMETEQLSKKKIKTGAIENLSAFPCEVRVRAVPLTSCKRRKRKEENSKQQPPQEETAFKVEKKWDPSFSSQLQIPQVTSTVKDNPAHVWLPGGNINYSSQSYLHPQKTSSFHSSSYNGSWSSLNLNEGLPLDDQIKSDPDSTVIFPNKVRGLWKQNVYNQTVQVKQEPYTWEHDYSKSTKNFDTSQIKQENIGFQQCSSPNKIKAQMCVNVKQEKLVGCDYKTRDCVIPMIPVKQENQPSPNTVIFQPQKVCKYEHQGHIFAQPATQSFQNFNYQPLNQSRGQVEVKVENSNDCRSQRNLFPDKLKQSFLDEKFGYVPNQIVKSENPQSREMLQKEHNYSQWSVPSSNFGGEGKQFAYEDHSYTHCRENWTALHPACPSAHPLWGHQTISPHHQLNYQAVGSESQFLTWNSHGPNPCLPPAQVKAESLGHVSNFADNKECFNDSQMGGVAIALGHGAVLFECAKHELHATTALRQPDRRQPTRISLVFYQHRNMNRSSHGASQWQEKMRQRKEAKLQPVPQGANYSTNTWTTLFPVHLCFLSGPSNS